MKHRRTVAAGMSCYLTPGYLRRFAELPEGMYGPRRCRTALAVLERYTFFSYLSSKLIRCKGDKLVIFSKCESFKKAGWANAPAVTVLFASSSQTYGAPKQYLEV